MASGKSQLPSIWLAEFTSKAEFDAKASELGAQLEVMAAIDDRMLMSRHPFDIKAWCAACKSVGNDQSHNHAKRDAAKYPERFDETGIAFEARRVGNFNIR